MDKETAKTMNQEVIKALAKEKNGYLNIKNIIIGFPSQLKKSLDFKSKIKAKDFSAKEALSRLGSHLEKRVLVYIKGNLIYLSLDSKENMILRKLKQTKSLPSFKMLRKNVVPLLKEDFTQVLNTLLMSGKVKCTFKGDNPILYLSDQIPVEPSAPVDLSEKAAVISENEKINDVEFFQKAMNFTGKGRRMVYIYLIRRRLNWTRERFDTLLRKLRAEYRIQLHGGDPSVMTEDQVRDSFMDERGILHISVSWRGK